MFNDFIVDMGSNNKLNPFVTKLFLRGKKLNILLVFLSHFYFNKAKTIRLNATYYFIMKVPNKRVLQQITSNHSCDIEFKDFMRLFKYYI